MFIDATDATNATNATEDENIDWNNLREQLLTFNTTNNSIK